LLLAAAAAAAAAAAERSRLPSSTSSQAARGSGFNGHGFTGSPGGSSLAAKSPPNLKPVRLKPMSPPEKRAAPSTRRPPSSSSSSYAAVAAASFDYVAAAHYNIGVCYCRGSNGVEVDMLMAMQWWAKVAEQGCLTAQCVIGEIYLMGFDEDVPVGTFDRDVPLGMKYLRAVAVAERESDGDDEAIAKAEALLRNFHAGRSCMGCGSPKARKLCGGSYCAPTCGGCVDAGQAKARYCGKACQLIHWRHQTASHKAECASRAATRDVSGAS
jgi:TPR repeat protein